MPTGKKAAVVRGECVSAPRLEGGENIPLDTVVNATRPGADRVASVFGLSLPLA